MARFDGSSYLRHPGLGDSALLWLHLELQFRPEAEDGLLLYNADRPDGTGDYLALVLRAGAVQLAVGAGGRAGAVQSAGKVELGAWHSITVRRAGSRATLALDSGPEVELEIGEAWLRLRQDLWLGSGPPRHPLPPRSQPAPTPRPRRAWATGRAARRG